MTTDADSSFAQKDSPVSFWLVLLWIALALLFPPVARANAIVVHTTVDGTAPTFTVNSSADVADANTGDGKCETAPNNGVCTLRAAIMEANHTPGGATIHFGLPGVVTYTLTIPKSGTDDEATGDLNITTTMTIIGNGADSTIIDGNGGALGDHVFEITGTVVISGVTIQHANSSNIGGGIATDGGALTLVNSAVINNNAGGLNDWGGGIFSAGSLTLTNSIVSGNTTGSSNAYGGGIFSQGGLRLINSTVSGNTTSGSPGYGGGIYNVGITTTLTGSTVSGNGAQNGGGIYKAGAPLIVINSTISGNHSNVDGGGIYNSSGTTSLFNATVTQNLANADASGFGVGGGVRNASGAFNFENSIIARNLNVIPTMPFPTLNDDDCAGALTSQGNNIIYYYDSGYCTINGSFAQTDPQLGPLQNNGGSTQTHALLKGSPAIDAGNSGGCTDNLGAILTTDQRGFHRPAFGGTGLRCDIGAYELQQLLYMPLIIK